MQPAGILAWLRQECEDLARLEEAQIDAGALRRVALDDMREAFAFPLKVVLRGYIGDVRIVRVGDEPPVRYLELIPLGLSAEVHRMIGGILFRCERQLEPGSVVTAGLELHDPATYSLHPPGLLATLVDLQAQLAIEP